MKKNSLMVKAKPLVIKTQLGNLITLFFLVLLFFFLSQNTSAQNDKVLFELNASKYLMGTEFTIIVVHSSIDSGKMAMYYALKEVERIEKVTSNYKDTTEISYVNRNAADRPVKVSEELFGLIKRSIEYSKKLDGIFDITVGPLTNYWGFNSEHPIETEPDKKIIDSLLKFVDYKNIQIDLVNLTIYFLKAGVNIDLGGIAKGYALDRASWILKNRNVNNFLINGGGDLYASGLKADGAKWKIGIKNPRDESKYISILELKDMCIATSGDYERYKIINGKRYHHILNPFNGYPAPLSQSSTVITQTCEEGVVVSKYFFILGYDKIKSMDYGNLYPFFIVDSEGLKHFNELFSDYHPLY